MASKHHKAIRVGPFFLEFRYSKGSLVSSFLWLIKQWQQWTAQTWNFPKILGLEKKRLRNCYDRGELGREGTTGAMEKSLTRIVEIYNLNLNLMLRKVSWRRKCQWPSVCFFVVSSH